MRKKSLNFNGICIDVFTYLPANWISLVEALRISKRLNVETKTFKPPSGKFIFYDFCNCSHMVQVCHIRTFFFVFKSTKPMTIFPICRIDCFHMSSSVITIGVKFQGKSVSPPAVQYSRFRWQKLIDRNNIFHLTWVKYLKKQVKSQGFSCCVLKRMSSTAR